MAISNRVHSTESVLEVLIKSDFAGHIWCRWDLLLKTFQTYESDFRRGAFALHLRDARNQTTAPMMTNATALSAIATIWTVPKDCDDVSLTRAETVGVGGGVSEMVGDGRGD
jgi:hypothetical protein